MFHCIPNDNLHCPQIEYSEIKKHNKKTKNNPNLIKFIFMFDNKSCIHLVAQVNNFNQSNYYPEINRDKKNNGQYFIFVVKLYWFNIPLILNRFQPFFLTFRHYKF